MALSDNPDSLARMSRGTVLQRNHIGRVARRGVVTLSYNGPLRKRVARMHGQDERVFFVVDVNAIPLPDEIEDLAQQVGMTLSGSAMETSFRELVAEAIVAEAVEKAPEHLLPIIGIDFSWPDSTLVSLERDSKEKEARVSALIREATARLKSKKSESLQVFDWSPVAASVARAPARAAAAVPHHADADPGPELAVSVAAADAPSVSDVVVQKIRAAVRAVRDQDTPQRLPAGARKAVESSAPGQLVWANNKVNSCRSLEDAIGGARAVAMRGTESAVIDWDGEQAVLVRRFATGGATAYRCEDSVKAERPKAEDEAPAMPEESP